MFNIKLLHVKCLLGLGKLNALLDVRIVSRYG